MEIGLTIILAFFVYQWIKQSDEIRRLQNDRKLIEKFIYYADKKLGIIENFGKWGNEASKKDDSNFEGRELVETTALLRKHKTNYEKTEAK